MNVSSLSINESALSRGAVDLLAQGALRRRRRVRGAQQFAAEVRPGHLLRRPLHLIIMDAGVLGGELGAHVHVEAVDHVDVIHLAAVETTAKLDDALTLLQAIIPERLLSGSPHCIMFIHVHEESNEGIE